MMSAAALLSSKPKPSDKDIDTAMNGNLCRCGTYLRIRRAIHVAAQYMQNQRQEAGDGVRGGLLCLEKESDELHPQDLLLGSF